MFRVSEKVSQLQSKVKSDQKPKRIDSLDIAKGILIILVIFGHGPQTRIHNIIYWFHIPAFFFISGLFVNGKKYDLIKLIKRTRQLIQSYFTFGLLLCIIMWFLNWRYTRLIDAEKMLSDLGNLVKGGRSLIGVFGVFWFINALVLINIVFFFLKNIKAWLLIPLTILIYLTAHLLSMNYGGEAPNVIWNADSALYCTVFFSLGYFLHPLMPYFRNHLFGLIVTLPGLILIVLELTHLFDYSLNVKYLMTGGWLLDLFIPLVFTGMIIYLSALLSFTKASAVLKYIGFHTQVIMYLHLVTIKVAGLFIKIDFNVIIYVLLGVSIPLLTAEIIDRTPFLKRIFIVK